MSEAHHVFNCKCSECAAPTSGKRGLDGLRDLQGAIRHGLDCIGITQHITELEWERVMRPVAAALAAQRDPEPEPEPEPELLGMSGFEFLYNSDKEDPKDFKSYARKYYHAGYVSALAQRDPVDTPRGRDNHGDRTEDGGVVVTNSDVALAHSAFEGVRHREHISVIKEADVIFPPQRATGSIPTKPSKEPQR